MSPKRPPSHVLEDASRNRLSSRFPTNWVIRDLPKDYGIDLEVEVFDHEDATGLTFKVQLKATSSTLETATKLKIKTDHLRYWSTLDAPVMVALYVESSDSFYFRWTRSHDPGLGGEKKATTTIAFSERDRLSSELGPTLVEDLMVFRSIVRHHLPRPLPLQLNSTLPGVSTGQLITEFRTWIEAHGLRPHINVIAGEDRLSARIELNANGVVARLPLNARSMTLHGRLHTENHAAECAAILGCLLARGSFKELSLLLLGASMGDSHAWHSPETLKVIVESIVESGQFGLGIAAADSLWSAGRLNHHDSMMVLLSPAILQSADLDEWDAASAARILLEVAAAFLARNEADFAGAAFFNAAGIIKHSNPAEAAELFTWALEQKPVYADEPRFWNQRAGCYFRAGRPDLAAIDYETEIGLDPECLSPLLPEYADALLFAGRFRECLELLETSDTSAHRLDRLGIVDRCTAETVIAITGRQSQSRQFGSAYDVAVMEPISFLTEIDALNAPAWAALCQNSSSPCLSLLIANARIQCKSALAWVAAAVKSFAVPADLRTRKALLEQGLVDGSPDFYGALQRVAREELEGDQSNSLIELLDGLAESVTEHRPEPWIFESHTAGKRSGKMSGTREE